ncbi:Sulfate permease, MFS superfamily [Alteribacillus persepolensis]|uniref:Sulfate permease, MFS superfamily n=1 Tax=Alteribacillus persepolensis TaxID=568899 RepID=A0A1G8A8F1_9BACI|nr:xanthine/uracil/vitamin C permease [Alteribacillus persepolensis]SDH17146.1 Sulfate permease, MFS superfamily [Alteribacillus persepolensis]
MALYKRKDGGEQPYWPVGKYKMRLPFIHYRLEAPELIQGLVIFTIGLSMIEIMTNVVGMSYQAALTVTIFSQFLMLIPPMFGVPFVTGFITPLIPVLVLFLSDFEPGPQAIQALIAVQLLVAVIFLVLGITGLGRTFITKLPTSLKAGILIGAGITAIMTEIEEGGRLAETPITLIAGGLLCLYIMFSLSFKRIYQKNKVLKFIANYGIMPAVVVAMIIGWVSSEYPSPQIEWGITVPSLSEMWGVSPFAVGFPGAELFLAAFPTAVLAYIIAYGDIVVGQKLIERANNSRRDEKIRYDLNQVHVLTFVRNFLHSLFLPHPGLAGPIFTAGTASVAERYTFGRRAMDSIFSGTNSLLISLALAIFILPLVTLFQPFLPIALSITLILTGYLCINIGIQQVRTEAEIGVAGVMAIVLAVYGAAYGLAAGLVLYFFIQRSSLFKKEGSHEDETLEKDAG